MIHSPLIIYIQVSAHMQTVLYAAESTLTQKHNSGTELAQAWTVALCPIVFAGPVAEHNKVFTLRHFSE